MKFSALRIPKTATALALTALTALIALALLAHAPTAGAHAPPLGPTFTFPSDMPQDRQDAYRDYFADLRAFSQNRFGASPNTSDLQITIDADEICVIVAWTKYKRVTINDGCIDESGLVRHSSTSIFIAEMYFRLLWDSWYRAETPAWTTEWMVEGSAKYFANLWLARYEDSTTYNNLRSDEIQLFSAVGDLAPLSGTYPYDDGGRALAFLAIDYLAEQTGATKPIDYFTTERLGPTFETHFQSVFGISPDAFYRYFAAHRAAGFPQPGAPFVFPTPTPTPLPIVAEGRIVFASDRDGSWDIYVMNADGTGTSRLTNDIWDNLEPAWSPNGKRIAFSSNRSYAEDDLGYAIYVMNADGTGVSRLTDGPGSSFYPAWSPDGKKIAFSWNKDWRGYEIYVMNADGTGVSLLTDDAIGASFAPTWSPDGQRIAFYAYREGNSDIDVYVMNSDGSNLTRLTDHPEPDWRPAWSPDGRRIAFVSRRDHVSQREHISKIYVMNADGSQQTRLTGQTGYHYNPVWSPDGRHIAFSTQRDGNYEIYVMNADGSNPTRITNHPGQDSDPDWTSSAGDPQIDNRVSALEQQTATLRQLLQNLQSLIQSLTNRITALESDTPHPTATATPTPTPTSAPDPDPTPVTDNACIQPIQPNLTTIGTWTTDCISANTPPDGNVHYAKFYTFTLDAASDVAISLNADERIYLYLLEGAGTDGNILREPNAAGSHIVRMTQTLNAGSYTIEATTWRPETLGDFILTLTTTE